VSINGKSVIAVIQVRAGSTRLPKKALLEIAGKPSIYYVIERVKHSQYIDQIILATTDLLQDDRLAVIGKELNVKVFRGSESDVLCRFVKCLNEEDKRYDLLVRGSGDNFLVCASVIDASLEKLVESDLDIVNPFIKPTFPFGSGAEVSTVSTLFKIEELTKHKEARYREHIFAFCYENPSLFKFCTLNAPPALARPKLNISVDKIEDFKKVKAFFESLPIEKRLICEVEEVVKYFDQYEGH